MKWMFQWVVLLVAALVQIQLPSTPWLGGMKCPLVLSCVLYYALAHGRTMWLVCALVGGMLYDAMSEIPLGYSPCLFLLVGWVASGFRRRLVIEAAMTSVVLGSILNVVFTLGLWFLLCHAALTDLRLFEGFVRLLAAGVLGAVTAPLVCGVLGSLEHTLGNRERSTGYA